MVGGIPCIESPSGDCLLMTHGYLFFFFILHSLSPLYVSLSLLLAMLDIFCCITIVPQMEKLKPTHVYYLAAAVSQEHRRGLVGFCTRAHSRCLAGLGSHMEAGLGKSPLLGSLIWLAEFISS